jgi:hypothetical protein
MKFAAVAWALQFHQDAVAKINVRYDNCPTQCVLNREKGLKEWDPHRAGYCEECPHREAADRFRENVDDVMRERIGDRRYSFTELLTSVRRAAACEGLDPDAITVKSSALLGAYLDERRKYDRYIQSQKPKP